MQTLLKILTLFTIFLPLAPVGAAAPAHFIDARDYFAADASYSAGVKALEAQFNDACGDTFCEGDYANLTSLGIDCAVDQASGAVGTCAWTFAGSYADVDSATGRVTVTKSVKVCYLPVNGDASALLAFVRSAGKAGAVYAGGLTQVPVPGDGRSVMNVLSACLN